MEDPQLPTQWKGVMRVLYAVYSAVGVSMTGLSHIGFMECYTFPDIFRDAL